MAAFNVYDVEFKSLTEFCRALGYSHAFSKNFIIKHYGSLENMAKTRLKLDYDYEIKPKLIALKSNVSNKDENKVTTDPAALAVLKAVFKQADPAVTGAIIAATAGILNIDLTELRQRVDNLLMQQIPQL